MRGTIAFSSIIKWFLTPFSRLQEAPLDSAYSIPDLASDIGPEDLARNFEHYSYGQSKQS